MADCERIIKEAIEASGVLDALGDEQQGERERLQREGFWLYRYDPKISNEKEQTS